MTRLIATWTTTTTTYATGDSRAKQAGALVRPAVAEELIGTKSREVRRRAADVLDALKAAPPSPQVVLSARGVEVLEQIATPAAKALIADWSRGPSDSPLTAESRASLGQGAR